MDSSHWQHVILLRLNQRNLREQAWQPIIEQYGKLSNQSLLYRDRNRALLKAAASTRSNNGSSAGPAADSAVHTAYISSLESQLSTSREELAAAYKVQSQNAQRLITLTDLIREKEDREKEEEGEKRVLRLELERYGRKVEEARELKKEQERNIQLLQDDLATLNLEFTQLEQRNDDLKRDNASLLKRWLAQKNNEVDQMNLNFEKSSTKLTKPSSTTANPNTLNNSNSPSNTTSSKKDNLQNKENTADKRPSPPSSTSTS